MVLRHQRVIDHPRHVFSKVKRAGQITRAFRRLFRVQRIEDVGWRNISERCSGHKKLLQGKNRKEPREIQPQMGIHAAGKMGGIGAFVNGCAVEAGEKLSVYVLPSVGPGNNSSTTANKTPLSNHITETT